MIESFVYRTIRKIGDPTLRSAAEMVARTILENWFYALCVLLLWYFPSIVADITHTEVTPDRFVRAGESVFWQSEMAQALIIATLAMSYNLLFGFSGIVSFGHALFFGAGAYISFIMMFQYDASFQFKALIAINFIVLCLALFTDIQVRNLFVLLVGGILAVLLLLPDKKELTFYQAVGMAVLGSMVISLVSGMMTLRLRGVYFAMFTLALAEVFVVLARSSTWVDITGGGDGLPIRDLFTTDRIPQDLIATPKRIGTGVPLTNRLHMYQITVAYFVLVFLAIRRYLNSPTGRVMMAIRENEERARTIGYNTFYYKLITMMFAGVIASLSGILFVLWGADKQVKPELLGLNYTVTPLLYSLIGGVGTLTGPVLAALGLELGETYFYNDTLSLGQSIHVFGLSVGTLWQWVCLIVLLGVLWFIRPSIHRSGERALKLARRFPTLNSVTHQETRFIQGYQGGVVALTIVFGLLIANGLAGGWKLNDKSYLVADIWQIFLGTLFVIAVMLLPNGIVGTWNKWRIQRRIRKMERDLQKHRD
jgi:branched-chain amino acid transport system permease protein